MSIITSPASAADDPTKLRTLGYRASAQVKKPEARSKPADSPAQVERFQSQDDVPPVLWPRENHDTVTVNRAGSSVPAQASQAVKETPNDRARTLANEVLDESFRRVPVVKGESRHQTNARIQSEDWTSETGANPSGVHYDGSEVVVIAFEGTGAFHPRRAQATQELHHRLREHGIDPKTVSGSAADYVSSALSDREGSPSGWSGLAVGPMEALAKDPELRDRTQWLSFPSEEVEALANVDGWKKHGSEVVENLWASHNNDTPGVNQAVKAVRDIQEQARAAGLPDPQIVVLSHSSGARSAVRFSEALRQVQDSEGHPTEVDLAFTIDPVREAHEAFGEALGSLTARGTEHNLNRGRKLLSRIPGVSLPEQPVGPALVRSRPQPESLYAPPNVHHFRSFYQTSDRNGLGVGPRFGIQGSPVAGAENETITGLGEHGHGTIAYHPKVTGAFLEELHDLAD